MENPTVDNFEKKENPIVDKLKEKGQGSEYYDLVLSSVLAVTPNFQSIDFMHVYLMLLGVIDQLEIDYNDEVLKSSIKDILKLFEDDKIMEQKMEIIRILNEQKKED